jgi:hypothetical protein
MTELLAEASTPGTWLIQVGKPRGRHVRRAHYFADGADQAICGIPDFHAKPSHATATRPSEDWRLAISDDPARTHHGSTERLDRTVCGNCLHELRVRAGTEQPRTHTHQL